MGPENLFLDCHWLSCSTAGLLTSNPNALQQSVIGGNFQGCNRAIFAGAGSVPTVHGVGFQTSADCDIYTGTLSDNAMSVKGCRSESVNFITNAGGQSLHLAGCSHVGASNGSFLAQPGGFCVVSACISNLGNVVPTLWATMRIENSWFKRDDWLFLDATHLWWKPNNTRSFCLELENVSAGSTEIRRQRIVTPDGQTLTTSNYTVG